jgi:hypothetical protein
MSRVIGRRRAFAGAEQLVPEDMRTHMSGMTQGVPVEYERAAGRAARGGRMGAIKDSLRKLVTKDVKGQMQVLPREQWIDTAQDAAGNAVMRLGGENGIRLKLTTGPLGHTAFSDIEGVNPETYQAHGRQVGDLMRRRYLASSVATPRLETMQNAIRGKATPVMPMSLDSDGFQTVKEKVNDSPILKYTIGPEINKLLTAYEKPGLSRSSQYRILDRLSELGSKVSGYPLQLTPARSDRTNAVYDYFQHLKKTDGGWSEGSKILDNKVDLMNNLGPGAQAALNSDPFWRGRQLYNYDLEMMGTRAPAGIVGLNKKDMDASKLSDVLMQHRYNPGFVGETVGAHRISGGKGRPAEYVTNDPLRVRDIAARRSGNIVRKQVFGAGSEVNPEPVGKYNLKALSDVPGQDNLRLKGYTDVLQAPLQVKGNKGIRHGLMDRLLYSNDELEQFNKAQRANEFRLNTNMGEVTGTAVPKLMSSEWRPGYGMYARLSGRLTPHEQKLRTGVQRTLKNMPSMWSHQPYAYDLGIANKGKVVAYETNPVGWSVWDLAELQDDPLLAIRHMSSNPYYSYGSYPEGIRSVLKGIRNYGLPAAAVGTGVGVPGYMAYRSHEQDK